MLEQLVHIYNKNQQEGIKLQGHPKNQITQPKIPAEQINSQQHNIYQIQQQNKGNSKISYPICFTYINKISWWGSPKEIASGIGVPGYASPTIYNFIALAFWSFDELLDIAKFWADPIKYFGKGSVFGNSNAQIQKNLKKKYNEKGIKVVVSAFGGTKKPTTENVDPVECANKLGQFVIENNLDGVDVDWQDNAAMKAGKGEDWLIKFQLRLRELLPNHIISHAPQAPYFKQQHYKNGAYVTVDRKVGHTIDFYNVQFYNQGNTQYNTYETLFMKSGSYFSKTSIAEIVERGIPIEKIVIGKPVTKNNASNTGVVNHEELGKWIARAEHELNWRTGVMYWQYCSDKEGKAIKSSAGYLKQKMGK